MNLSDEENKWFGSALAPIVRYIAGRIPNIKRIAICDTQDEVLVICDSRIVVTIDRVNFKCISCVPELKGRSDVFCNMVHGFCKKLSCIRYKVRQVVMYSKSGNWGYSSPTGEVTISTDKIGERVILLRF